MSKPFYENIPRNNRPYSNPPFQIARADRKPCPVCGHPTGDCADDYKGPRHIFGQPDEENLVRVPKDIIEEVTLASGAKTKIILARKGSYVTRKEAEDLGIS